MDALLQYHRTAILTIWATGFTVNTDKNKVVT